MDESAACRKNLYAAGMTAGLHTPACRASRKNCNHATKEEYQYKHPSPRPKRGFTRGRFCSENATSPRCHSQRSKRIKQTMQMSVTRRAAIPRP